MSKSSVRWAFNFASWKPTQAEMLLATSCIQPEEKQRIAKFVFKKDFKASLVGRLMMRKFINTATNIPYNDIKISRDKNEKPFFECNDKYIKLNFNVSHQGNYTVLSGELDGTQVGVDVMQISYSGGKTLDEFFRIMTRQFSSHEWLQIKASHDELSKLTTFCRNWCLKESYVKAIGVGITINLQEINFKINSNNLTVDDIVTDTELFIKNEKQPWIFEEMLLDCNHCVATALYNSNGLSSNTYIPTNFTHLSFNDLVENAVPVLGSDLEYCLKFFGKNE